MATLHIRHAITDLPTWTAAFRRFDEARRNAGVTSHRVRHPVGDPQSVVIDLEFATVPEAEAFLGFLRANVWSSPEASPALIGAPDALVLELHEEG